MAALGERGTDPVARVETMVGRHGPALLRVANQFSLCHDDALDAYQRALEIYLRRMDTVEVATEGAWMRVVVKHEAMAIRKARAASVDATDTDFDASESGLREVSDAVAGGERVGRSVEALKALKPDEARALLLKAEGLSYDEIGTRFGWSYTKVNRSIAEGRKRFLNVFSEIESGEACAAYEDTLDALARGQATSVQMVSIRPHLRHCAACRATVRQMRFSRTRRLALLAPFGWITRLLTRPEVVQLSSSGGGRFGTAASIVGLCLTGAGAGAACVMTGALPAPAIIATVDKPAATATPAPKRDKPEGDKREPVKTKPVKVVPEVPARKYAALATPTPPPPPAKPKRKAAAPERKRKPVVIAKRKRQEFGFEGSPAAPAPAATATAPVASAASAGGASGSAPSRPSSGGGASKSSGEFGFEGG
ncbi:RNA polymerase sigma factor [Solirubrobacter sp. CPCC 204708]|uniref:RNA polymerase sigma factor n=1 Tax=Solirubrobacter deserti TaxID=2282478 RepID=A0ABT4RKV8_9ACTN|nr:RNA polymerase sigma factor [Solirubrobacter deserti]MBE2319085.1 RNA polymerase sigma factor [Solirubrobacter deserti]MDA0139164.1 RNA polymerase sigma factor [Solirubrobacter deserti]